MIPRFRPVTSAEMAMCEGPAQIAEAPADPVFVPLEPDGRGCVRGRTERSTP